MTKDLSRSMQLELFQLLGEENVIVDRGDLERYLGDLSPFPPLTPAAVVRPSTPEGAASVLKFANRSGLKVLTRGGGASFTGYVMLEAAKTIVLETRLMNKVIDVDMEDMTVTAQCGAILSDLEGEVAKKGLYVHTVTTPVRYSTLGGILSGVAGGGIPIRGAAVGNDADFLLGLKVVLPNGSILATSPRRSGRAGDDFLRGGNGPDVCGLFVGDAGMLGIKVEATLKLFHQRRLTVAGSWLFRSVDEAWSAIRRMTRLEPLPYTQVKVRDSEEVEIVCVSEEQSEARLTADAEEIEDSMRRSGGRRAPDILQEAAKHYSEYMRADDRVRSPKGMLAYFVPNSAFLAVYAKVKRLLELRTSSLRRSGLSISLSSTFRPSAYTSVYVNHMILYDGGDERAKTAVRDLLLEGYARAVELGGCPEPHQGLSSIELSKSWSREYRSLIQGVKNLVDPCNTLNPGVWGIRTDDVQINDSPASILEGKRRRRSGLKKRVSKGL